VLEAVRERWQAGRGEAAARWRGLCLLTLLVLTGYAIFVFAIATLNVGEFPNYYVGFRAFEGIVETITLSMPLRERYNLVAGQPLVAFGYRHPVMGSLEGLYVLTVHALLSFILMSALIALYCLFMNRALRARGLTPRTLAGFILGGGSSVMGVLTAGAATVACCGGAGVSVVLSLLGVGAGAGLFLVEHERVLGAVGLGLMLVNLWVTVGWIVSARRSAPEHRIVLPGPAFGALSRRPAPEISDPHRRAS
jgi:hypothetical protein